MKKPNKKEIQAAIAELRERIKVGNTIGVILRHVSTSGMMRYLSFYHGENNITYLVCDALGERCHNYRGNNALKAGGCGMDIGFNAVYNLGRALFPEGFKPREAGRSFGRNGTSPDEIDTDGGYALTHRYL